MTRRVRCPPVPCLALGVLACVVSVAPRSARAESVELRWEIGADIEGCPTATEVEALIVEALPEAWVGGERLVVHAHIDRLDAGPLRLELWAQRDRSAGRRVLEASSCASLADAAALIVSMLVAPLEAEGDSSTTTTEAEAPDVRDSGWLAGSGATVDDPFEDPEAGPVSELRLAVSGGVSIGPLPSPSPLVGVSIELCVGRVCPFLGVDFVFPAGTELQSPAGAGVELWLLTSRLGVRHRTELGPVSLGPLVSVDVGALGARSHDVSDPSSGLGAWVSASAGAFADAGTRSFRVGLYAVAQVPLVRPRIEVERAGTVFEVAPVGFVTALSLEARFD